MVKRLRGMYFSLGGPRREERLKSISRRDLLKTSLLAPAVAATAHGMVPLGSSMPAAGQDSASRPASLPPQSTGPGTGRERLLLDFGWRFHFGNANDAAKDFGFGSGRSGNFQKTGNFLPAGTLAFDDSDLQHVDLPHDWAVELSFENDAALSSKGFYPLGRNYPATVDGKVDGNRVSFKAGNSSYSGTLNGDEIELDRKVDFGFQLPHPEEPTGSRPAIGPPPDGSDPSRSPSWHLPDSILVVLRRVQR